MPDKKEMIVSTEELGAVSKELEDNANEKPALAMFLAKLLESPEADAKTLAVVEKIVRNEASPEEVTLLQDSLAQWINGNR